MENKELKNKKNRLLTGFTIIELIVVIAIIAVLAAIVLVNVTQYIAKGKDSSIKGNMSSMATIAAAYYDNNSSNFLAGGSTATTLNDAAWQAGVAAINDANGPSNSVTSNVISSAWCVQSALNATGSWCVDSTGYKGNTASCDNSAANCQ